MEDAFRPFNPFRSTSPLYEACERGDEEEVNRILHQEVNVSERPSSSRLEPISIAATNGHANIVRILLLAHSHSKYNKDILAFAFEQACATGHLDIIDILLEPSGILDYIGQSNFEPMIAACSSGQTLVVHLLLNLGACINPKRPDSSYNFRTPLFAACQTAHMETVRVLLDRGADPNIPSCYSYTRLASNLFATTMQAPIRRLREQPVREQIFGMLLDRGANIHDIDALQNASYNGMAALVARFIEAKVDLNLFGLHDTALQAAAEPGHVEIVKMLIIAHADPDLKEKKPSALMLAVQGDHTAVADILLEAGADANATDIEDRTVLQLAIAHASGGLVRLLLQKGVGVDNDHGRLEETIGYAVRRRDSGVTNALLDSNLEIDFKKNGASVLHPSEKQAE